MDQLLQYNVDMKTKQILVPIDFSKSQDRVIAQAKVLAQRVSAELILLYCATPPELSVVAIEPIYVPAIVMETFTRDHSEQVAKKLNALVDELSDSVAVTTLVKATNPIDGIISVATEKEVEFIVMGSHGGGIERFLLGSVAESITRLAPCPVVVVKRQEQPTALRNVIVGIDFSGYSRPLVELARNLCTPDATIHLIHGWQPPHLDSAHLFGSTGHQSLLGTLTDGLREHSSQLENFVFNLPDDARYVLHVETGRPAGVLLDMAKELKADGVFLGAHDSEGLESILGSVSDRVLRHGETTILLTELALANEKKRAAKK